MKKIKKCGMLFVAIAFQEIIFSLFAFKSLEHVLLKIIFTLQFSLLTSLLFCFKEKINKIICGSVILFSTIMCSAQIAYYNLFESSINIYDIIKGKQMVTFATPVLSVFLRTWYVMIILAIPFVIFVLLNRRINIDKNSKKEVFCYLILFIIFYVLSTGILLLDKEEDIYSAKNVYYNINSGVDNLKYFGVVTTMRLDLQRTILPFKEKTLYKYEDDAGNIKILDKSKYNMINIDFDKLITDEVNDEIKELHKYLSTQEPTKKNSYTGNFEGKNLIVIVGESFSSIAINKEITPTLYMLANQGLQFTNYYTPLFPISTADGQYAIDTGIIPAEGTWSMEEMDGNYYPYSFGNSFKKLGYKTFAYHNYYYDYYSRDKYFKAMGFDTYLGWGNGLEKRMDFSVWPASDYDMVSTTIEDYVNEDKFVAYYITMSGHMKYDNTNDMVTKNWDRVKELPYTDNVKGYLATQIELDKSLEKIITILKDKNKLEDTVILLLGDHYPYGLTESEIKQMSSYKIIDYSIDKFHMPLIIYNSGNTDKIEVNKYASSIDVLPTILNLFGVEYDSRLIMGRDILSNSKSLVIFSNRSFLTNTEKYNSQTGILIRDGLKVEDSEYIKKMKQNIYYKYRYSRLILKNDYFRSISN